MERIAAAPIPIAIWVGPSGARLYGTPAQLLAVADVTGMAPGARVGHTGVPLRPNGVPVDFGEAADALRDGSLGLSDARAPRRVRAAHLRRGHPDDRQHGQRPRRLRGGRRRAGDDRGVRRLDDGTPRRDTTATVRFAKLGLVDQLFHTVASPAVTYLLLLIGLALLIFEFFTAGVGVAGVVGAACVVLACTGLADAAGARVGRRRRSSPRCSPSPSTCRSACRGSGPASASC